MVVIIFTTSLTIFVSTYVPKWMEENEAHHMREVSNEFCNLKATIDTQILRADVSDENDTGSDITIYTPIPLGNKGIPMFASETSGSLSINSYQNSFTLLNDTKTFVTSKGNIIFTSQNKYFVSQQYIYENGAIIIKQEGSEFIKVPGYFEIENKSGGIKISILMVYLIGEKSGLTGTSVEEVSSTLSIYREESHNLKGDELQFNITTYYKSAWMDYFNNTFKEEDMEYNIDYSFEMVDENSFILKIKNVNNLDIIFSGIKTKMSVGWNS